MYAYFWFVLLLQKAELTKEIARWPLLYKCSDIAEWLIIRYFSTVYIANFTRLSVAYRLPNIIKNWLFTSCAFNLKAIPSKNNNIEMLSHLSTTNMNTSKLWSSKNYHISFDRVRLCLHFKMFKTNFTEWCNRNRTHFFRKNFSMKINLITYAPIKTNFSIPSENNPI